MTKALKVRTVSLTDAAVETPIYTVAQAKSEAFDVAAATAEVRDLKSKGDRIVGAVMWNAALTVFNAVEVHKDVVFGDAPGQFKDQTDYVVRGLGFSKGYGTLLKRLGRAAVVHGVKHGTHEWGFLASNVNKGPVSKAIMLEDTDAFRAAIKGYRAEMEEHGEIKGAARTPQTPDGGETGNGEETGTRETPEETVAKRPATVDDVLGMLDEMVKNLDREAWAAVENRLDRIVTRENTLRAKKAAEETASK